jgi:penicillin-binding protein 1C
MTETTARQVQDMLRGVAVPDGVANPQRDIAYKTGTSYGFRDALAIGSSRGFTVAVWVGRTEGTPRPGSYGRNTAAPLLFRVFDLLPPEQVEPHVVQTRQPVRAAALRHFAPAAGFQSSGDDGVAMLRILFPPAGARIEAAHIATGMAPMTLEVSGGIPPYQWVINGRPLSPAPIGAPISWRPDGLGFFTVSVTDSMHHAATADFQLE